MILLVGSISLGVVASVIGDNRQRRAFLDTRQSYEMRLTIEDQAREQVSHRNSPKNVKFPARWQFKPFKSSSNCYCS